MKISAWIILLYGLLVLVGGFIGHIQAGSTASLIMGGICGILLLLSSIGMFKNKLFPAYIAILLTLGLDGFFTYRFLLSFSFFPAGMMSLISLVVLLLIAYLLRKDLNRQINNSSKNRK